MDDRDAEDILLEKRAETQDGKISSKIQELGIIEYIGIRYAGYSNDSYGCAIKDYSDLDNIFSLLSDTDQYPNIRSFVNDERFDGTIFRTELRDLISDCTPTCTDRRIDAKLMYQIPVIGLNIQTTMGDNWTIILNKYNILDEDNIINNMHLNQDFNIFQDKNPYININDSKISVDIFRDNRDIRDILDTKKYEKFSKCLNLSEYDVWLNVKLDSFELSDDTDNIMIEVSDFNKKWILDNPKFWNKDNENAVKLIENFANGDPNNLDHILVRPRYEYDQSISTALSEDKSWLLALEKPNKTTTDINQDDSKSKYLDKFNIF